MRKGLLILLVLFSSLNAVAQEIKSPNGKLSFSFELSVDGEPTYKLSFNGKAVIQKSRLGIELKELPPFTKGFTIAKVEQSQLDETWAPVWGQEKEIRNHYNELAVTLQQASVNNRRMIMRFRLFDDGLGFRYEFPEQTDLKYFIVMDEKTEFNLTGDHKAFWIPGDYDTNEYAYSTTKISEVDATKGAAAQDIAFKSPKAANVVQTPLMMKTSDGLYINIHEAALINYPAMNLTIDRQTFGLSSHLVPDAFGNKAYIQAPDKTPWRTIVVSDKAADILASRLILNLNEPSRIKDVSWIKPQKYVGIWWEMHVGKASWNYSDVGSVKLAETDWASLKPNGKHGATTANTKRYIDFAARHGFDGVLVEGWNVGWEDWFGNWKEEVFDFVTPYPDFNVDELQKYASEKGVKLIMHHETSASVTNYERRMDDAYRFMKQHGYDAVKTGYVGRIIPRGEHHDGQWMVNHYVRVAAKTAQNKIMLDVHEPVRPTGLHRTYPNWLACEAARGNEFNAWSVGSPPEHETILPFTRLMGGPMDYTPGIFQIKLDYYQPGKKEQVHTTLAKQLALYVTMYSPLQMAADLPENYERFLDAFQFIKDVPVDWDDTRILEAEPGDYLTIARKAKNKDEWYIGSITDEQSRTSNISLSYLTPKRWYVATLYADAADAHWENNPMAYQIQNFLVNDKTIVKINLASGGGAAISLKPASDQDLKKWKPYRSSS
ncbi:MAG TPA: glycoside hydrolase family 97 protein [Pyrinomonadaceae bacterium]|nr:glycoside hydrolase family 97 protein [Pyrinomonadaceae bacterium]